jgi:riboflavin kinase/FMN adenylyltransferase
MPGDRYVIALGFFDGVHLGHAQLIEMAKKRGESLDAVPAVLSFDASPMSVVTGTAVPLIGDVASREDIIRRCFGVERVIIYHFDRTLMQTPWKDFIDALIEDFHAVHLVIGHDFSCGYRGEGRAEAISAYCAQRGLGCDVIPEYKLDGITVSSSYIRERIESGDIKTVNRFLGRAYSVSGSIRRGEQIGRRLGAPTINLIGDPKLALPKYGVYATVVSIGGRSYKAVTNVGVRPTFKGGDAVTVESFLLNFSGEVYGELARVEFYDFLRPERKFPDAGSLKAQIEKDAQKAALILEQQGFAAE